MNPPPAPERLRDLARKLRALMDDPAATDGERTAARDRLRALMADLEGDRWQRKAGHLDTPTLQLHN